MHWLSTITGIKIEDYLNRFWEWSTHDAVSFYTTVLAVFTAVLSIVALVQIWYLKRADKTARITASAAKNSADAAIASEAARFYIVIENTNFYTLIRRTGPEWTPALTEDSQHLDTLICVNYHFRNYGKTPGIKIDLCGCANCR